MTFNFSANGLTTNVTPTAYVTFGTVDNPPTFSGYSVNTTTVNKPVNFSVVITDATALSGFIFETNNTGTFVNTTFAALSSGSLATNITILNATIGTLVNVTWYANDSANQWSVYRNQITTTAADTCTYTSGNWNINCADNCVNSIPVAMGGNNIVISGTGTFKTTSDITNYLRLSIIGTSSANRCIVTCNGGCFKR